MDSRPGPAVIIPVHNAFEELKACLESVAATVSSDTQVMIIDDASTDGRIIPLIEETVQKGGPRWRSVRQVRNLGFVGTVNLGMRLSVTDVVLLNSDTVVTEGWLQRMSACLASDDRIATVTPWSNNAEITSIPEFCKANAAPTNADAIASAIAELINRGGGPEYPELPTAVGFCMGISRQSIEAIGYFDVEHFGLGYGEENDFSIRARQAGFRNVLCDDAYVVHLGGRSFGPLGLRPDETSMARLLERHPNYQQEVMAFIDSDPLSGLRERLCSRIIAAGLTFD